jgi:basic membrane protein A and related proteins
VSLFQRSIMLLTRGAVIALVISVSAAHAQAPSKPKFNPAVIYYLPQSATDAKGTQVTDNAFIAAARIGIGRAAGEYGITIPEHRVTDSDQIAATIKKVADSGATPIIALGSQNVAPVLNLAERYPGTQFTVIDGLVPPLFPNVQSVLFKDNEGSFLVGFIAGRIATSGKIGFIGGMDSPHIRNFETGFVQGVKYANPDADVVSDMIGNTAAAWNNREKARMLAMAQYNRGTEVIFAAAGGSTIGVLDAANQTHKFAIGVDSNQNGIYPGRVLTSLVKRVDVVIYDALKRSRDGSWSPGLKYLGIKEGALDYAVDDNNRTLLSERLIEDVATAKERIVNGIITVNSYTPK